MTDFDNLSASNSPDFAENSDHPSADGWNCGPEPSEPEASTLVTGATEEIHTPDFKVNGEMAEPPENFVEAESQAVEEPAWEPEIESREGEKPQFRPLWTVGNTHAPFADVSLKDDSGVSVALPNEETPKWRMWARESLGIVRDISLALAVAILIGVFVIQPVKVEGTSMLPRLHDGERIFINRFIYNFRKIERGDIVVFYYPKDPGKNFIKRVIGLPGDEITISNGKLRINGQLVPENYLSRDYTANISAPHTWVVEPHHYFVMGDNRDASNDSRSWGFVPEMYIYGKAVYRYWPLSEAGSIGDDPADLKPLRQLGQAAQNETDDE